MSEKKDKNVGNFQGYHSIPYLLLKECEPLTRRSSFSYQCGRCNRCCSHNRISLNPYEIARLARGQGISTTEFIRNFTTKGGTELLRDAEERCVFLSEQGCCVHADRPLVCRLYPLCRNSKTESGEAFLLLTPDADTEGAYGTAGTVESFLASQNAGEFIKAVDIYYDFFSRAVSAVEALGNGTKADQLLQRWIDIDLMITEFCAPKILSVPSDLDERIKLHLKILALELEQVLSVAGDAEGDN